MRRGEVQHWRFINAGIFKYLNLALDGHTLNVYSHDGNPRARLLAIAPGGANGVVLAPGNRSGVLVKAEAPGTYYLRTLAVQMGRPGPRYFPRTSSPRSS